MIRAPFFLGLAAALSGTGGAYGAAGPRLLPARDVTVAYQVDVPRGPPIDVRVAIAAGGERLRIVGEDLPTSFLVDRQTETAAIVLPMLKTYTRVSIARYDPTQTVLRGAGFARGRPDNMVGLPCTHWHAHSGQGEADACITADGVILQGSLTSDRKGNVGTVRAVRVDYGALPPAIFAVPDNYSESPLGQAAAQFIK
jgi:hypothetical protein